MNNVTAITASVETLVAAGGKVWAAKDGGVRVYFNDLEELFGLECDYFGTGNIRSAKLDGAAISNGYARKISSDLCSLKVWVEAGVVHVKPTLRLALDYDYVAIFAEALVDRFSA